MRNLHRVLAMCGVLFALCACLQVRASDDVEVVVHAPSSIAADLSPGQHRRYRLDLAAGKATTLSLRQNDAMLHLEIREGGASAIVQMTQAGREAMLQRRLLASTATQWSIDVSAAKANRTASYRLEIGAAHAIEANDRLQHEADRAFDSAESIRVAAGGVEPGRQPADIDKGRADYRAAVSAWRAAADGCAALRAGVGLARFELALAQYPAAQSAAAAALADRCDERDPAHLADRAAALRTLAAALGYQGNYEASADFSERALAIYRRTHDRRFEGVVLGNLSEVYRALGETQKSLHAAEDALQIALDSGDAQGVEFSRGNIASSYLARGDFGLALQTYRQTLDDLRTTPYPLAEGLVWNELGSLYRRLGEFDDARAAWARARAIWSTSGNRSGMAETWIDEGEAALDERADAKAGAAFARALEIARTDHLQSPQLHALLGLGRVAMATSDPARARTDLVDALARAVALSETAGVVAAQQALGDLDASLERWDDARGHYRVALDTAVHAADVSAQTAALASIARADFHAGDPMSASAGIDRALALVEGQRSAIADPELRTGFFSSQHAYFSLAVDIEMALEGRSPGRGHAARALEIAERARARSLQDQLAERSITIDVDVDPALLDAERSAEDTQRRLAYRLARSEVSASSAQRSRLDADIRAAARAVDAARGRIRVANPRYADIVQPKPLRVVDVQRELLDDDTAILEYWLGESASTLWVIDRHAVTAWVLPSRARIAAAARALRERVGARAAADAGVSIEQRVASDAADADATSVLASALADLVLPADARARLAGQWAIVADGELQDVPFALVAAAVMQEPAPVFVQLPSIGALRGLRALPRGRAPADALAIVADPVFTRDDPRLPKSAAATNSAVAATAMSKLPRLVQARAEAESIAAMGSPAHSWMAVDFAATREAVLHARWSDYAVAHFATHALVDARHPELSGIVMSLFDAAGNAQDGVVRMNDLYALDMPLDLVVLGVCNSAEGPSHAGEGVASLARAFFHAGTRRVVASLWPVDDRASAEIMRAFYSALLVDHASPQRALGVAQAQMRQNPRWRAAWYWSGYVVQGDWR